MAMKGSLLFLGSGSSAGVPEIGCHCSVCSSSLEKNKRLRPSCLLEIKNKKFLLDASPDLRVQFLRHDILHIDGLILTHAHYDHIGGLDELRKLNLMEHHPIDCLLSEDTFAEIKKSFYYMFKPLNKESTLFTQLNFSILKENSGIVNFKDVWISYFSYFQKETKITGYKIGNLAYISDIKKYSDEIFKFLEGVDILILSALRKEVSPVHFNLDEAIAFAEMVNPKKTFFTHIAHELDHEEVNAMLPATMSLAFDGLKIGFNYER